MGEAAEYSIPSRTPGRCNREDRRDIDGAEVTALHSDAELIAHAVAEKLSVSPGIVLRIAGVPMRPAGGHCPFLRRWRNGHRRVDRAQR